MSEHYGMRAPRSALERNLEEQVRYWKKQHAEAWARTWRAERKIRNYRVLCSGLALALAYALFALWS